MARDRIVIWSLNPGRYKLQPAFNGFSRQEGVFHGAIRSQEANVGFNNPGYYSTMMHQTHQPTSFGSSYGSSTTANNSIGTIRVESSNNFQSGGFSADQMQMDESSEWFH